MSIINTDELTDKEEEAIFAAAFSTENDSEIAELQPKLSAPARRDLNRDARLKHLDKQRIFLPPESNRKYDQKCKENKRTVQSFDGIPRNRILFYQLSLRKFIGKSQYLTDAESRRVIKRFEKASNNFFFGAASRRFETKRVTRCQFNHDYKHPHVHGNISMPADDNPRANLQSVQEFMKKFAERDPWVNPSDIYCEIAKSLEQCASYSSREDGNESAIQIF